MPSPAQLQILEAVDAFITRHGYSPSFDELAVERGSIMKSGVARHLHSLKAQGLVDFIPKHARTLKVTDTGLEALLAYRQALGLADLNERLVRVADWVSHEITAPPHIRDDALAIMDTLSDGGIA